MAASLPLQNPLAWWCSLNDEAVHYDLGHVLDGLKQFGNAELAPIRARLLHYLQLVAGSGFLDELLHLGVSKEILYLD